VEQVEAYATERTWDRHLVLGLKAAAALDPAEAAWFVLEGFHAHAPTMIDPYPRYAELAALAARGGAFDIGALRDLQVWQKLAWVDPDLLRLDPRATRLVEKGRDFDEQDKAALRGLELDVLRRVIPAYRAAAAAGQAELSTSPYFHPILPLLCDSSAHHAAHPGAPLPEPPFRHPEDARLQLTRAVEAHQRGFGERPRGVWPSEGSVSDAAAALVAEAGFDWMATDEDILARSSSALAFGPGSLYRPHLLETPSGEVRVLFRDHAISDLVGFTYQSWQAEAAAGLGGGRGRGGGRMGGGPGAPHPVVGGSLGGGHAGGPEAGGGRRGVRGL
jgi:alpha-amylase/alpha-mannosidase (GH57 family)